MYQKDRKELIVEILKRDKFVSVNDLAKLTYTSASSIRRDLTALENKGVVSRFYGGARLTGSDNIAAPFERRLNKNHIEKNIIAKKASSLLCDNQTIILDSSSSSYYMIPYIAKLKNPTVFTNNMLTAEKLIECGVKTYCTGGTSENNTYVLTGSIACDCIKNICADILFFSTFAIDEDGILSDCTEAENYLRQLMIKSSKTSVFLCDSEKLRTRSLFRLCDVSEIDYIFCDKVIDFL